MLGHTVFRYLAGQSSVDVLGSVRSSSSLRGLEAELRERLLTGVDADSTDSLVGALSLARPDVVINCVGLVKQLSSANDPLVAIPINSILPHRLARLCALARARLVHVSTDCVFAGDRGGYVETDTSDAKDLYGRTKYLGEVDAPNAVTLRTSIIGHELNGAHGLVEWFLAQSGEVRGFSKAFFSGVPTVELARVITEHVLPNPDLRGVYHVASERISKLDLLKLVAREYERSTTITPDDSLVLDRSLDGRRFRDLTGYVAPAWPDLVRLMRTFH